jgi:hypothetical protein
VIIDPLPGQEEGNIDFGASADAGIQLRLRLAVMGEQAQPPAGRPGDHGQRPATGGYNVTGRPVRPDS